MLAVVGGRGVGGWCVSLVTCLVLTAAITTTQGLSESIVSGRPLECTSSLPKNNKNRYDSSLPTFKEKNEDGKKYRENTQERSLSVMQTILAPGRGKSLNSKLTQADSLEEYDFRETSQHKNESLVVNQQAYVSQPSTVPTSTATEPIYHSGSNVLLLCEPPPWKFSPHFLGTSSQFCSGKSKKHILFPEVRKLCNTMYGFIYNEKDIDVVKVINVLRGWTRRVYFDANYMRLCLPLLNRFDRCRNNSFVTVCSQSRLVFPNLESCTPPHHNKLVFGHLLAANIGRKHATCLAKLCRGFYRLERGRVNNMRYRIFNLNLYSKIRDCSYELDPEYFENASTTYTTYNTHWPLCYGMHQVVWAGNPSDHGLNGAWSYLPASCRAGEVVLMVMVAVVAVVGITGNSLVVTVMMKGSCRCSKTSESILLRTSLAVSDLLMGAFVVIPSFFFHLDPFMSPEKYLSLDVYEGRVVTYRDNKTIPISSAELTSDPWKIMQMICVCVCSIASLLVLSMLSVERFVITRRALKYRDYITVPRVVLAITLTWLMGVCQASLIIYNEHFHSFIPFYTFSKLTIPTPEFNSANLLLLSVTVVVTSTLGLSIVCTSVFSTLAIINFARGLSSVAEEWKALNITTSPQYKKESRHIIITQLLMTGLYLLSTLPLTITFLSGLLGFKLSIELESYYLLHYLKWWVFLASSAWNPWLYNFRSWQFRKEVTQTLIALMPNCLRKKYLAATMTPHATNERVARRLLKVGLLPYDGQLN